jgi:hypothetical protein
MLTSHGFPAVPRSNDFRALQNVRTDRRACYCARRMRNRLLARACCALALSSAGCALEACDKGGDAKGDRPPPPPMPASSHTDACANGGGQDTDALSAPFVPRSSGGYCIDPQSEPKTYGDKGKLTMDEVCTSAFDGECEVYKRFGLDRVVVLRYVDGTGAPNSVEVNLSRFKTVDGAYAMFTKRVVADGDPASASVKALAAQAAGATSSSNAYVWRSTYLAELTFVTEDTKMTPEAMALANEHSTAAIAKEIGSRLPGSTDLPPSAAVLPEAGRLPLGIAYYPKDALGMTAVGPLAVGYYQDGEKRWRGVAGVRSDVESAKETFRAFKREKGAVPVTALGEEAVQITLQEGPDRAKADYLVARKASLVAGVGDEELVLDPSIPAEKQATRKLTKSQKLAKLAAWLK